MSLTQINLDSDILAKLDSVAESMRLTRDDALRLAISAFVEDREFREDVEQGISDLEVGRVFSANDVDDYFAKKREMLKKQIGL